MYARNIKIYARNILVICAVLLAAISANAQNSTPSDVADLVGARAAGGETQLKNRGYRFIKTEEGDDRTWSNWWNARRKICLNVVTMDGRFDSIVSGPSADCNQSGDSGGGGSGNGEKVDVSDLVGVRASSGESEMQRRGFRNVDALRSGDTSYTIWYRKSSRQCIQVATADGRYDSLTGIQTHPKCR